MPTDTTPARRRSRSTTAGTASAAPENVALSTVFYSGISVPVGDTTLDHEGRRILTSDSIRLSGENYHRGDSEVCTCTRCATPALREDAREVLVTNGGSRELWCENCADDAWECDNCDNHCSDNVRRAYRSDDHDHDDPLCPSCRPREENSIYGRLLNYSNKAISSVPPADPSSILFGLEVETHVKNNRSTDEAIRELHRLMGDGYYVTKSDGSLTNGFEIVTRPDSMKIHREQWLKMFESIDASPFLKENLRSWSAPRQCCGIHCHVDKAALSQLHLGKLNVFLNHKNNRTFIEKIAGRGSNSYTSFRDDVRVIDGRRLKAGTSPERYVALNVGVHTAEMRLFRGTLNPETFFGILDFIEASVEWTGMGNCSARSVSNVNDFSAFVHAEPYRYPFLLSKIKEWGIEPTKSK